MRTFRFRAARQNGSVARGVLNAHGSEEVDHVLLSQGLEPIAVHEEASVTRTGVRPSRQELSIVLRSLSSLYTSGVPLSSALAAAEAALGNQRLRPALAEARRLVSEGQTLTDALERSGLLSPILLGVLRAGEASGELGSGLDQAAGHAEQEAALLQRLQRALAYPLILLVVGTISLAVIGLLVLPRFASLLRDFDQTLPRTTWLLVAVSDQLRTRWPWFLMGFGALVVLARYWAQSPQNMASAQELLLGLPVIGRFRLAAATARLARSLGPMLGTGAPLLRALSVARLGVGDYSLDRRLALVIDEVASGGGLAAALSNHHAVLPAVLPLVAIGESNGRLAEMIHRAGDLAATEAQRLLDSFVTLIEPMLVLLFGAAIAIVAAGMLQAVYGLRPGG